MSSFDVSASMILTKILSIYFETNSVVIIPVLASLTTASSLARSSAISNLMLQESNKTTFGIEVKKDAHHPGGFNIFGSQFGDYAQHIIFTANYK